MKKQLVLIALAGGALMLAAPKANAQITGPTLTSTQIQNEAVAKGATVITVEGTIEQYLNFTDVADLNIELGNIGGATINKADVHSVEGRVGTATGTDPFSKDTDSASTLGDAHIDFQSNTNIQIAFSGRNIKGTTGAAAGNGSTVIARELPTAYRLAPKGKVTYSNGVFFDGPGGTGQTPIYAPTSARNYGSYTPAVPAATVAAGSATIPGMTLRFAGGGPTNTGTGTPSAANAESGFYIAADVDRKGTNDPAGTYSGSLTLTYSTF